MTMNGHISISIREAFSDGDGVSQLVVVEVCCNYEPIQEEGAKIIVSGRAFFDKNATSFLGGQGARVIKPNQYELQRAVHTLRRRYGSETPVTDNLGVLPESLLRFW